MPPAEYTRFSFVSLELFDTVTHIMGYARSQEEFDAFVNIMYGELQRLYRLFDAFNGYSDIHNIFTINAEAGIRPVEAHPDLLDMIKTGIRAYHMTDGVVNIAIGPITAIWRTYISSGEASLPDMHALRAADRFTDINGIIIDEEKGTVFLSHAGMALDVGSIGKGYALERAVQKAIDAGFASFILSVGGDVRTANGPPGGNGNRNGNAWRIGVNDPIHPSAMIDTLSVADLAVFTSGDYLRGPHIIDPRTLLPADTVRSATVIHPDGITAEILSLAVFIMDIGTARELLANHGAEVLWVMADGSVISTEGFGRYR